MDDATEDLDVTGKWGDKVPLDKLRDRAEKMGIARAAERSRDELLALLKFGKPSQAQATESPEQAMAPRAESD